MKSLLLMLPFVAASFFSSLDPVASSTHQTSYQLYRPEASFVTRFHSLPPHVTASSLQTDPQALLDFIAKERNLVPTELQLGRVWNDGSFQHVQLQHILPPHNLSVLNHHCKASFSSQGRLLSYSIDFASSPRVQQCLSPKTHDQVVERALQEFGQSALSQSKTFSVPGGLEEVLVATASDVVVPALAMQLDVDGQPMYK
ncbi:hypothetical protein HDU91_001215, partial [Kappamyces sp. JEL0680]